MTRIYVPSAGPGSWQQFLADPEKQWRTGYSAKSLAYSWEEADGFPTEIRNVLDDSGVDALKDIEPLLVIPEHKVPLPGGSTQSQNDAFVLGATDDATDREVGVGCTEGLSVVGDVSGKSLAHRLNDAR